MAFSFIDHNDKITREVMKDFHRENYKSDGEYFDAIATEVTRRSTPEYQRAYKQIEAIAEQERIEEQREAEKKAYADYANNYKLNGDERRIINEQASEKAIDAYRKGYIDEKQIKAETEKQYMAMEKQYKTDKASSAIFNDMIRKSVQGYTENE